MSKSAATTSHSMREKCFLCEVPRGPWAMLHDYTHPVCRACCNYEGTVRIAEVLDKAKHLRQVFDTALPVSEAMALKVSHADVAAAVNLMPAVTVATAGRPMMRHSWPVIPQPGKVLVSSAPFLGLTQPQAVSVDRGAPILYAAMQPRPVHVAEPTQLQTHYSTTRSFAQIKDTQNTLYKSLPFRVRFSKDHSLIGRVIAFYAAFRCTRYDLKVCIEYPIGSQTVFQSASGAGRQMYYEFRERLGMGGGFRGAMSNGYKDLEFEKQFGDDKWRVLGELLTEEVRFFRRPVKKELLPTPYVDPNHPTIPPIPPAIYYSRGFLRDNPFSNEEAAEESKARKKRRVQDKNVSNGHHSPKQAQSPHSPAHATPTAAGSPRAATNGVGSNPSSLHSPPAKTGTSPTHLSPATVCLLCHRTLVEDTRFVQCLSQTQHKFCFSCVRESIVQQQGKSSYVYCPSGMRCSVTVTGTTIPLVLDEEQITTIKNLV